MPRADDIANQQELLDAHRQTLAVYLRRQALHGEAHASPEIVNGMRAARASIAQSKAALRAWGQVVDDLPDDSAPAEPTVWRGLSRPTLLGGAIAGAIVIIAIIAAVVVLRGPTNANYGSGNVLNTGTIGQLTINTGDSPEVRQQKATRAKQLVVQDTLANIGSLDARLAFVSAALTPVADPLATVRQTVAPASQSAAAVGYQQLIATEQVGALRQSLNGRPLRLEFGAPLVQVLVDSGADATSVRSFYDELAATNDATESLMSTLEQAARKAGDNTKRTFWAERIVLARDTLHNRSQTAYLFGLLGLRDMGATPTDAAALTFLHELEPRQIAEPDEVNRQLQGVLQEALTLTQRRQELIVQGQQQIATDVGAYSDLGQQLVIQPSDTPEQVVKKARSLRDLGRIDDAVAAFARYGDMFNADPTSAQYSRVARALTRQIGTLRVGGGAYVYGIAEGSAAQNAGIAIGDILVSYNGTPIADADQATQAIQAAPAGVEVIVEWLRLNAAGQLVRQQARVPSGKLGVAMMLI